MVYQWEKSVAGMMKVSAQTVGNICDRLRNTPEGCTKESLLEAARPKNSPIHKLYEWDDRIAGEKYRLHQSSSILRHIVVVLEENPTQLPSRAFVRVQRSEDESPAYQNIRIAMSDPVLRKQVVERALRELEVFRIKYHELKELKEVFEAINHVREVSIPKVKHKLVFRRTPRGTKAVARKKAKRGRVKSAA